MQWNNGLGDEGAKAIAAALQQGAEDTTLHVRVPGKPVESTGLDCVIRGGLPPEWPILCNTPACVLTRWWHLPSAEGAKDKDQPSVLVRLNAPLSRAQTSQISTSALSLRHFISVPGFSTPLSQQQQKQQQQRVGLVPSAARDPALIHVIAAISGGSPQTTFLPSWGPNPLLASSPSNGSFLFYFSSTF